MSHPLNVIYDFIPATGQVVASSDTQRVITNTASCNTCHAKLGGLVGTASAGFHEGNRYDPALCVVCHTDQRKYGRSNVASTNLAFPAGSSTYVADGVTVGNLPVLVHKVHMGNELVKQNYNFARVLLNETKFPQDIRNCTTCHDGSSTAAHPAPQGDNWKNVPNATACGACHDGINFATGLGVTLADAAQGLTTSKYGHVGGAQPDDSRCAICHTPDAINVSHTPVTPPDPANSLLVASGSAYTNAASLAGNPNHLPAGAIAVTYDIKSVTVDATTGRPSMVFRMLQNGTAVPFNSAASKAEMWDNFVGSPSAYFVFAVPQDGIQAPADFNASVSGHLRNIWNGSATGHRRRHARRARHRRLLHADADGGEDSRQRRDGHRRPGLRLRPQRHPAADPGQPARVPDGGLARQPGAAHRRPGHDRARRHDGGHRLHRAARHRAGQQLQRLPPATGPVHGRGLPCRAAQRRRELLVVPQPEPHQQRLVGGFDVVRARHPRFVEAHAALHLACGPRRPTPSPTSATRAS